MFAKCINKIHTLVSLLMMLLKLVHIREGLHSTYSISSYLLKLAMPLIEGSLEYLLNTSLEASQSPDLQIIARVSPIFLDGDKTETSNYRPILVLPVVSRLLEKLVFNQFYWYLNVNCFINSKQSGFRELHSTVTSLPKNTDYWYNGMDTRNLTGMVFVELKSIRYC